MTRGNRMNSARTIIAISLAAVVVAVAIVGVVLLDSPAQARLRRLDERRIADLRELSNAIDIYWTREGRLPVSLEELAGEEYIVRELVDPETGEPYEYREGSEDHYELCVVFATATDSRERGIPYEYVWFHDQGWQCFQLTAQHLERELMR